MSLSVSSSTVSSTSWAARGARTGRSIPATTFLAGHSPRPVDGWFDDVPMEKRFAYGCDLFDAGCYFEAHELWESLWMSVRDGVDANEPMLHGLIRLAAAGVKWRVGQPSPQQSHLEGARRYLDEAVARHASLLTTLPASTVTQAIDDLAAGHRPTLAPPSNEPSSVPSSVPSSAKGS